MKKRTLILVEQLQIDSRKQKGQIRFKLPDNLVQIVQVATTTRAAGPIQSNALYFGTALGSVGVPLIDENFVKGLASNEELVQSDYHFKVAAQTGEKIYVAHPKRWGVAHFIIEDEKGLTEGGFMAAKKLAITDESGFAEEYYLYESLEADLEATIYIS